MKKKLEELNNRISQLEATLQEYENANTDDQTLISDMNNTITHLKVRETALIKIIDYLIQEKNKELDEAKKRYSSRINRAFMSEEEKKLVRVSQKHNVSAYQSKLLMDHAGMHYLEVLENQMDPVSMHYLEVIENQTEEKLGTFAGIDMKEFSSLYVLSDQLRIGH